METRENEQRETVLKDGRNCYLRIVLEEGDSPGYELRMINRTQPPHFLRMSLMEQAHQMFLDYNITGLVPLSEVDKREILSYLYSVVSSLSRVGEECKEYLIPPENIDLKPAHIFLRMETGQVYYAYAPEKNESMQLSLQKLLEYFMKNTNLVREEDVLNVYGLYQRTLEPNVTYQSLYEYLQESRAKNAEEEMAEYGLSKRFAKKATGKQAMDAEMCGRLGIEIPEETAFSEWSEKKAQSAEEISWNSDEDFGPTPKRPVSWYAQEEPAETSPQPASKKAGVFEKLRKFLSGKSLEIGVGVLIFAMSFWLLLS